ncbi:adenylate kinase family protein [Mastigocladopsis repens]|uniref:adenylate kinase family protein n=1 Tax=Mastigocladopsis repens TaxID=221287 RepID=UPI0002F3391C|nr:adenylate kinase [Mastigocladopsis repens]
MRLVILGGSGAGKSTQAQELCRYFDIPLISDGEILPDAMAQSAAPPATSVSFNNLGCLSHSHLEMGELVSDKIMIELIQTRLKKPDFDRGWVLEGYPRTAFEAEELDFLLDNLGHNLDWAIYLQVPQAVMVSRSLGRSLPDDQPEIVQRRVEIFYDRTIPILEYYDRRRRLLTINGDQFPEVVHHNIVTLLSTPE